MAAGKNAIALIVAGIIIALLVIGAIILALLGSVGTPDAEDENKWDVAEQDIVSKEDSDFYMSDTNDKIPWPDKLSDIEENYIFGTNYTNPDTDGDGMEDGWEAYYARLNPITGRLTLDPNVYDPFGNPDGDGYDVYPVWSEYLSGIKVDHIGNGIFDGDDTMGTGDNLTNIEEYCGGYLPDPENFESTSGKEYIARHYGFHLAYKKLAPGGIIMSEEEQQDWYLRYEPSRDGDVTTNPSLWDSDNDGMDDGYELHYQHECEKYWPTANSEEFYKTYAWNNNTQIYEKVPYWYSLSPLNSSDGKMDFDIRQMDVDPDVEGMEWVIQRDSLTNKQEYENSTDPTKWDTDGDSYYDPITNTFFELDDRTELETRYDKTITLPGGQKITIPDSSTDWSHDGLVDNITDPKSADTDGDLMPDGWELKKGLNPLNASDRFLDLDGDGLQNYLEYSYPTYHTRWFTTDPFQWDSDEDGMPDGWEAFNAKILYEDSNPSPDIDDNDGIADGIFRQFSVNPMMVDWEQDLDGLWYDDNNDGVPDWHHYSDNLTNIEEYRPGYWAKNEYGVDVWIASGPYLIGTDPNNPDTDGDNITDGDELKIGFHGQLIGDRYFTNPEFTLKYFTNASSADSDSDADLTNVSRVLDDWEETRGINREILDYDGLDNDGDGEIDEEGEQLIFSPTNATNPDTDIDGLNDVDELFGIWTGEYYWSDPTSGFGWVFTDPCVKDSDMDHLSDKMELDRFAGYKPYITDPNDPDTDQDGLEDGLEWLTDFYPWVDYDTSDNYDANNDGDLLDEDDIINGIDHTNPRLADTDGDGLPDGWEHDEGRTNDLAMIKTYDKTFKTQIYDNVRHNDIDDDGYLDTWKVWLVNPLNPADVYEDPDNDELNNYEEWVNGTDPLNWDTDGDGMPDGWEIEKAHWDYDDDTNRWGWNLDPNDPSDWYEDPDHDGHTYQFLTSVAGGEIELVKYYFPWCNLYEYQFGINLDDDVVLEATTHPNLPDSDYDGMPDGYEYWTTDMIGNLSNPGTYEDNDTLSAGWEDLFNGSKWNTPETYIHTESEIPSEVITFRPLGLILNPSMYEGKLWSTSDDSDGNYWMDGEEDYDNDGFNNTYEYQRHTDPTDSQSYPSRASTRDEPAEDIPDTEESQGGATLEEKPVSKQERVEMVAVEAIKRNKEMVLVDKTELQSSKD